MNDRFAGPRVLRSGDGDVTGAGNNLDRYLLESAASGGSLAVVEHTLEPKVLAAPVHRHSREDEYSLVLDGTLAVMEEGEVATATRGDFVFKPRGRWHTFWNAGEDQLRVLEIICPGGIEALFRRLVEPGGEYSPETLPALAAEYGAEVDFDATMVLVERYGLNF